MDQGDLEISVRDGVGVVAIARPETKNALRRRTFEELRAAIAGFVETDDVRAMVLTGTEGTFSSGADLSDPMMGNHLPPEKRGAACAEVLDSLMHALIRDIRNAPFPIVTAVNGIAAGGGVGLALAGDVTIAARSAGFLLTFTSKLGLVPDLGTSWQLAHHLGRARALGVALLGERISAEKAAGLGMIWDVVADDVLQATAMELALRLAAGPLSGQVATRRLVDRAFVNGFDAQLDAERDAQAGLVGGPEVEEAMRAFGERRTPDFTGIGKPK
ncbi:2-(1,2-epoxy-1,2-dihydrophenyl)acetyl-CoA isomerase [Amorphus suaedae]